MPVYRAARPKGFLAFRLSFLRIIARPDAGPSVSAWDRDVGRQLSTRIFRQVPSFSLFNGQYAG
jgi:hypothetical protein